MSTSTQTTTVPEGPHGAGSALPREDGSAPDETFRIKGNSNSGLYHGEESQGYADTKAEVWFSSEEAAEAAGFKAWNWRSRDRKARQAARAAARPARVPAQAASAEQSVTAPETETEPEKAPAAPESVPEGPHGPGSAHPLDDEDASSPHERFHVKGNADSGLFHTTDSPHYKRTKAEVWFASNEHAEAAGFRHWNHRTEESERSDTVPHGPHGAGSAHPDEDASSPHDRFHVKGNADSGLYHTTDSPHYGRTKAEVWFASEEHAEAAGFKHWKRHKAK